MLGQRHERALDHGRLGETCRIANHISPSKERRISNFGDVYQGFYSRDWQKVDHIPRLRMQYPAIREHQKAVSGPFPQGPSQEELVRNRGFASSHGSDRIPHGIIKSGSLLLVP